MSVYYGFHWIYGGFPLSPTSFETIILFGLFLYFFFVRVMKTYGLVSLRACQNKKLIINVPRKFGRCLKKVFLVYLTTFLSPLTGGIYARDTLSAPELYKKEINCVGCLMDVSVGRRTFTWLTSSKLL